MLPVAGRILKCGLCLRTVVESEHRLDDPIQLGGQVHRSRTAAVRAAGMSCLLELNGEGGAELCHAARQHHRATRGVLLHHEQMLRLRKGADPREVGRIGAVFARESLSAQIVGRAPGGGERLDAFAHELCGAATHDDAHLQALRGVRGGNYPGARYCGAFTALQWNVCHGFSPRGGMSSGKCSRR